MISRIQITKPLSLLWHLKAQAARDNLGLIAAGVAFYMMMAVFPGIAALISLWGLVADRIQVMEFIDQFRALIPDAAFSLLHQQALDIAGGPDAVLTLSLVGSIALTMFSASAGVKALIMGLNIVYNEQEKRGIVHLNLLGLGLTFFLVAAVMLCLVLILAVPELMRYFVSPRVILLWQWARWLFLFAAAIGIFAVLYRYGPCCRHRRWEFLGAGSLFATMLWLSASALFSFYVANYGKYNETYGSIGGVIILLMWFWLSALSVLLGAELNAGIERHRIQKIQANTTY